MISEVFIVVLAGTSVIESVWTSLALANAAIIFHAKQSNLPTTRYNIVIRLLNVTVKP